MGIESNVGSANATARVHSRDGQENRCVRSAEAGTVKITKRNMFILMGLALVLVTFAIDQRVGAISQCAYLYGLLVGRMKP